MHAQVPAVMKVQDIAGLVRGASEGAGLGNEFLSHIAAVDAIFHVVRVFDDDEVVHVEGSVDPVRDVEIITNELRLKDIQLIDKKEEALAKMTCRGIGGKPTKVCLCWCGCNCWTPCLLALYMSCRLTPFAYPLP